MIYSRFADGSLQSDFTSCRHSLNTIATPPPFLTMRDWCSILYIGGSNCDIDISSKSDPSHVSQINNASKSFSTIKSCIHRDLLFTDRTFRLHILIYLHTLIFLTLTWFSHCAGREGVDICMGMGLRTVLGCAKLVLTVGSVCCGRTGVLEATAN